MTSYCFLLKPLKNTPPLERVPWISRLHYVEEDWTPEGWKKSGIKTQKQMEQNVFSRFSKIFEKKCTFLRSRSMDPTRPEKKMWLFFPLEIPGQPPKYPDFFLACGADKRQEFPKHTSYFLRGDQCFQFSWHILSKIGLPSRKKNENFWFCYSKKTAVLKVTKI